ncbi:ABC transporter ATP-binding protein [Sutcliffiella rhizosphaerae]|uniref:Vitamin B12 import ATP-binding protein BtuD n=1 Tax=Sutcliffiella rhizosphaerae TaxID=2880967 RepID=A0ABM8YUL3_9BACI|nr:ABC transporter ATP-binding protein [Sutcliffiella rhizosphaerae]CAG9623682.1 Vitamin B12 import ATP-binding protein BtuD [Sutcliffiella rhizosphaerae]
MGKSAFIWSYNLLKKASPKDLFLTIFISLFLALLSAISLKLLSLLVNSGQEIFLGGQSFSVIFIAIFYFLTALVLPNALNILSSWITERLQKYSQMEISKKIMMKSTRINLEILEDSEYQDALEKIRGVNSEVITGYWKKNIEIYMAVIQLVSTLAILFYFHWILPLLWIIISIPDFLYKNIAAKRQVTLFEEQMTLMRRMNYYSDLLFNVSCVKETKVYRMWNYIYQNYKEGSEKFTNLQLSIDKKNEKDNLIGQLIFFIAHRISLIIAIHLVIVGDLSVGAFTAFFFAGNYVIQALNIFSKSISELKRDEILINKIINFLDEKEPPREGTKVFEYNKFEIEFKNVTYKYPNALVNALDNVSFKIYNGEKISIVGDNGSGKSTLIRLLLGLSNPTSGEILVNGVNLTKLNDEEFKRNTAVVFQDYGKYYLSLGENIGLGNLSEINSILSLDRAASQSGADKIVKKYEHKYNQMLGNLYKNGVELSGGEWQKISLARGYIRNAMLLIMDEPTASLDPIAEFEVYKQFINLSDNKTSILISHRLGSATLSDRIIHLKKGKVIENGSHTELMKINSYYRELFIKQASWYQDVKDIKGLNNINA